ncbi:endonuclease/exonuclease/phosphatase family protein [Streptomyces litchfieldiae]|uniref:Endonuclease/exonuclease/phosphatase family protein n=1 Tax=Streptomyces litchfieldiae TaxID=3075543 RepID=A0ABU2MKM7_9ACTN|nr:endonuclease/exonuclease/phosphatase family protein [Streptomyces sp. DSM 44938]MDT0341468.1 endonuclease/exonuclease/phosphatase family protein [Streptomyces sp. DSM 44938]
MSVTQRMWRGLIAAVLVTAAAAAAAPAAGATATGVRVLDWNIQGATGTDGVTDIDRVGDLIAQQNPDVVTLQEVHNNAAIGAENQWQVLLDRFPQYEAHFARSDDNALGGSAGNLILSRYPIEERLTRLLPQYPADSTAVRRSLGGVRVDVGGTDLRVYTTHLSSGIGAEATERRNRQARDVLTALPAALMTSPMLLTGDLNVRPGDAIRPWFAEAGWIDAWTTVNANTGAGAITHPGSGDDARIDYVYATPAFQVSAARTVPTTASDHLPVVVDLTVRDTAVSRAATVLAGAAEQSGWAQLAVHAGGSPTLHVCDNKADGYGVRGYVRNAAGTTVVTGADGAFADRCGTFTSAAGTASGTLTVRVCLYAGGQESNCREVSSRT